MPKGRGQSLLLTVLTINSAVLAVLLLLYEFNLIGGAKPIAYSPAPTPTKKASLDSPSSARRVAGARIVQLSGDTTQFAGSGKILAKGNLALSGSGSYAVTANGDGATVNGQPLLLGQIVRQDAPQAFTISGTDIFVEVYGDSVQLTASGYGALSPDITASAQVPH